MINGMSLFTAGTVGATGLTVSWAAPSGTAPTGYEISVISLPPSGSTSPPVVTESFYTDKTTATLPTLMVGQSYVFLISAILDGAANFESSPNRSALPTANMSVVSTPISINSGP